MTETSKPVPAPTGTEIAEAVIRQRTLALKRRSKAISQSKPPKTVAKAPPTGPGAKYASKPPIGHLVALGDSWFDYPGQAFRHTDILAQLEDLGWNVESAARAGAPIEEMAHNPSGQLANLARCFEKVAAHRAVPRAVLLSGGGNDIAGEDFAMLVNNRHSPIAGWNEHVVAGVIDRRIAAAYRTVIEAVTELSRQYAGQVLPILVHGYGHAVPDGRGYAGGWGPLPGPWLKPGFTEKQFTDLGVTTGMIEKLIDRFNDMLDKLAGQYPHVHYVDLRGMLSNKLPNGYRKSWANELHPEPDLFEAIAGRFSKLLEKLP